ncbi:MAG: hypothetical protein MI810_25070 [Flavobacteriales bacterium]|jgi:hypothetical protein|nr:hypothetical protein [Flavobacteriales bacterium]
MRKVKKLLVILFIVSLYPIIHFTALHFYLNADDEIYEHIPQESDIVIEINCRNFVQEIMYQKIFNEDYFQEKLFPPDEDELGKRPINLDIGINVFSKIIILREQWAEEDVWLAIFEYTNKTALQKFIEEEVGEASIAYGDTYAVAQINRSTTESSLDEHLQKIADGDVKPFSDRIDLKTYFDPNKEINVYLLHDAGTSHAKLIDGHLHYDFLHDRISVSGEFTPVSDFAGTPAIAYEMNDDVAMSIRSSISLFNSLYWFGKDRIDDIPEFRQLAFDYDGVNIMLCDKNLDYPFPFKTFPDMDVHFDFDDPQPWNDFLQAMVDDGEVKLDTTTKMLSTKSGTFFKYNISDSEFEFMRDQTSFKAASEETDVFFDFRLNVDPLLANTKLAIDENDPPSKAEQTIGLGFGNGFIADLRKMANVESMWYTMRLNNEERMLAEGEILMKEKEGSAMIESLSFGSLASILLQDL